LSTKKHFRFCFSYLKDKIRRVFLLFFLFSPALTYSQTVDDFYLEKNFNTEAVIAEIDSIKISAEEFYLSYEFGPAFVRKKKNSRLTHLNYMINEKLLALDGYSRGIDTTEEAELMIEEFKNDIAAEEMFKDKILSEISVSDSAVDSIITEKSLQLELKWIYNPDESGTKEILKKLNSGISFDSLFNAQVNDSVHFDDRYLRSDLYQLKKKNPALARIIDTLKAGDVSLPVHVEDGWYIIKIDNISQNIVTTESEFLRLKQEAKNAAIKIEMDKLSDEFVQNLMLKNNPVIKRDAFNVVRSYLGKYLLPPDDYEDWQLEQKLNASLQKLDDIPKAALVTLSGGEISIKDFLQWYRNRSNYIKLNRNSIKDFSLSLEQMIWRMVRDKLIAGEAAALNYDKSETVMKQSSWWKDKIVSSIVRNEIANSVIVSSGEIADADTSGHSSDADAINFEFRKKMLHKILALKQKYKISIDENVLNNIPVSQENDPKAIELYSVKKGGLIPRTPYPTINHEWADWE